MIFVDADSCAQKARNYALQAAAKRNIRVELVANRKIPLPFESGLFSVRICGHEKDSADRFILEKAAEGDTVVTRDWLLADALLKRNVSVLNDDGVIFTRENIGRFLEERELSLEMKSLGVSPAVMRNSYGRDDLQKFKINLNKILGNS